MLSQLSSSNVENPCKTFWIWTPHLPYWKADVNQSKTFDITIAFHTYTCMQICIISFIWEISTVKGDRTWVIGGIHCTIGILAEFLLRGGEFSKEQLCNLSKVSHLLIKVLDKHCFVARFYVNMSIRFANRTRTYTFIFFICEFPDPRCPMSSPVQACFQCLL
jgi:hypothetical protein